MFIDDHEKRRRWLLRVAGARDGKVYIGPEIVHIAVTNRCNLSCHYCWFHSPGNPIHSLPPRDMSFKDFQEIVRDCVDLEVDTLYFCAEGEPTLHSRFSEMMSFLEKQPLSSVLFTHGAFPMARLSDVVKADEVIVNLGAVDRKSYRFLQGKDLFDKVIENIRRLVRFRDSNKPSLKIAAVFVVNTMNACQIKKAETVFKELRVDSFEPTILRECDYNRHLRTDASGDSLRGTGGFSPLCFNGWFYATTALNGNVRFCSQIPRWAIASLDKLSFREAWFSRAFMKARMDGRCGRLRAKFEECHKCSWQRRNMSVARKLIMKNPAWNKKKGSRGTELR